MVKAKSPVPLGVELGAIPPPPETIRDDQKLPDKTSQDITDKYAKYADEAPDGPGRLSWLYSSTSSLESTAIGTHYHSVLDTSIVRGVTRSSICPDSRLDDYIRLGIPDFVASYGLIVCTFLTAECERYRQLLLVQGLFTGLFSGIIYAQAISVVSH
ncbi:hypothetical protein F5141DRAFT_1217247 [Pisolithus sp. B1]|nr:hypothetical protein F5141DRAFT_1217247 [Pisolithus sp. B1]